MIDNDIICSSKCNNGGLWPDQGYISIHWNKQNIMLLLFCLVSLWVFLTPLSTIFQHTVINMLTSHLTRDH